MLYLPSILALTTAFLATQIFAAPGEMAAAKHHTSTLITTTTRAMKTSTSTGPHPLDKNCFAHCEVGPNSTYCYDECSGIPDGQGPFDHPRPTSTTTASNPNHTMDQSCFTKCQIQGGGFCQDVCAGYTAGEGPGDPALGGGGDDHQGEEQYIGPPST